jgi:SAM-dependent methyltransferase
MDKRVVSQGRYEVTGIDISPGMIALAQHRDCGARFLILDYEVGPIPGEFDAAVIYDAPHHAEIEYLVIKNVYDALVPGGVLITIEPGRGHSTSADSLDAVAKYGTTEKDMPYSIQKKHMERAGFTKIKQYPRAVARGTFVGHLLSPLRFALGSSSVVIAVE